MQKRMDEMKRQEEERQRKVRLCYHAGLFGGAIFCHRIFILVTGSKDPYKDCTPSMRLGLRVRPVPSPSKARVILGGGMR